MKRTLYLVPSSAIFQTLRLTYATNRPIERVDSSAMNESGAGFIHPEAEDGTFLTTACLSSMDKEDARYQTLEQLHERRKQAAYRTRIRNR